MKRTFTFTFVAIVALLASSLAAQRKESQDDPFGTGSSTGKGSTKKPILQDPFADDPLPGAKKAKKRKAGAANPFETGGGGADPFAADPPKTKGKKETAAPRNPFGTGKAGGDPFGKSPKQDGAKGKPNPFGAATSRAAARKPFGGGDGDPFGGGNTKPPKRKTKRKAVSLEQALQQETSLEFIETPLRECVDYLKTLHETPVYVDQRALAELGLGPDTAVTMNVSGVSLRYGLNVLCDNLGLDWMIDNEVIAITSPAKAKAKGRTVVYDTSRLVRSGANADTIAHLVGSLVSGPERKRSGGGMAAMMSTGLGGEEVDMSGMMEAMMGGEDGGAPRVLPRNVFVHRASLVIRGTEREHHLILGVLTMLAEHQKFAAQLTENPQVLRQAVSRLHASKSSVRIDTALTQDTTLEFIDSPLREVTDYLKDLHKVQFQIDQRSLEQNGLGADTPVTQNLSGISLNAGLNLMLNELGLTWSVRNDMVMIVTQQDAVRRPTIKAYFVSDLVSKEDPISRLQDIVTSTMKSYQAPISRRKGARPAVDRRQVLGFQHTLFVSGTEEDHQRINRLLSQLRKK